MLFLKQKNTTKAVGYEPLFIFFLALILSACGGGGGSSHNQAAAAPSIPNTTAPSTPTPPANNSAILQCPTTSAFSVSAPPAQTTNTVSGRVTFDRILFFPYQPNPETGDPSGLDYANPQTLPARGVVVEALASSDGSQCNGAVLATALTDGDGWYQLMPTAAANVCVRVRAQLYRLSDGSSSANWNFSVADNTNGNVLYAMIEASAASANDRPRRDLHAAAGLSNGNYTSARGAAPFAILDTVCKAMDAVLIDYPSTQFGTLTLMWSTRNTNDSNGTREQGKIGGAFFDSNIDAIYLRGDAVVNTDEFDEMVIAHEFGHFVTHRLSRSDSVGGDHNLFEYVDPRLAFDEGWATAFAALALQNPIYRDSDEVTTASSQWREFSFDVRQRSNSYPVGWFSESSMQRALYTLGSNVSDGGIGMGLGTLLQTFSGNYKQTEALAAIFSYGEILKNDQPVFAGAVASTLDLEQINGDQITAFADNENNAPSYLDLPVYKMLTATGMANKQEIFSTGGVASYGTENTLSARRYIRFKPPITGRYLFSVKPNSGSGVAGFELLDRGNRLVYLEGSRAGSTLTANSGSTLQADRSYVLSIFHVGNVVTNTVVAPGDQYFQVWADKL